jgi:translocator protein
MVNKFRLVVSILVCELAGVIGSLFTSSVTGWYSALAKPSFNPPSWVFGPAWAVLYLLMGISLYLVWNSKHEKTAMVIFGIQLFLNAAWSIIFFGFRNVFLAFVDIILLWIFILITMILFYRVNKTSFYILIPYLAWVSFAALLNYWILVLN